MELDLEFAMVLTWVEMALVYGIVLPVVLPIATLAMAAHMFTFRWLVVHRGVPALPGTLPPTAYLQVALVLQAMLSVWFFNASEMSGSASSVMTGVAVSIVVISCAVLARRRAYFRSRKTDELESRQCICDK